MVRSSLYYAELFGHFEPLIPSKLNDQLVNFLEMTCWDFDWNGIDFWD